MGPNYGIESSSFARPTTMIKCGSGKTISIMAIAFASHSASSAPLKSFRPAKKGDFPMSNAAPNSGEHVCGVKTEDIIVFERYRDEFIAAKMHESVPDSIARTGLGIGHNATDPVAMDHVAWRYVDAKRKEHGLPPVAASGKSGLDPLQKEGFDIRQPQHIPLAVHLGLGIFDFNSPKGKRSEIQHRVVNLT